LFLRFDDDGALLSVTRPKALTRYGRLRSVTSTTDGDLLVTTDNGADDGAGDRVLRISPRPQG
jgi:glucose/arabinose dehydrogenase